MHVDGRCHCGQITYEADVEPALTSVCHCTDCQMLTGSAYRVSVRAPRESFRLLTGKPTTYIKTAESGAKRIHAFCPTCGAPVYASAAEDNPSVYALRVGCLRQRAELAPKKQIWCRSSLQWSGDLGGLPRTDRQ